MNREKERKMSRDVGSIRPGSGKGPRQTERFKAALGKRKTKASSQFL